MFNFIKKSFTKGEPEIKQKMEDEIPTERNPKIGDVYIRNSDYWQISEERILKITNVTSDNGIVQCRIYGNGVTEARGCSDCIPVFMIRESYTLESEDE